MDATTTSCFTNRFMINNLAKVRPFLKRLGNLSKWVEEGISFCDGLFFPSIWEVSS